MKNYKVELWFADYTEPEISYHFHCHNEDVAIEKALEETDGELVDIVDMIEWDEI